MLRLDAKQPGRHVDERGDEQVGLRVLVQPPRPTLEPREFEGAQHAPTPFGFPGGAPRMWCSNTYWAVSMGHQTISPSHEPSPPCSSSKRAPALFNAGPASRSPTPVAGADTRPTRPWRHRRRRRSLTGRFRSFALAWKPGTRAPECAGPARLLRRPHFSPCTRAGSRATSTRDEQGAHTASLAPQGQPPSSYERRITARIPRAAVRPNEKPRRTVEVSSQASRRVVR